MESNIAIPSDGKTLGAVEELGHLGQVMVK